LWQEREKIQRNNQRPKKKPRFQWVWRAPAKKKSEGFSLSSILPSARESEHSSAAKCKIIFAGALGRAQFFPKPPLAGLLGLGSSAFFPILARARENGPLPRLGALFRPPPGERAAAPKVAAPHVAPAGPAFGGPERASRENVGAARKFLGAAAAFSRKE
jgi:hypothetical protein